MVAKQIYKILLCLLLAQGGFYLQAGNTIQEICR